MPVVMHLIDSAGVYGAEKVLLELAMRTRKRAGWQVLVGSMLAPDSRHDPLGAAAGEAGLKLMSFHLPDGFRPKHFKAIIQQARQAGVDLFHTHGFKANIATSLQPRRADRIPVVASLHGSTATAHFSAAQLRSLLENSLLHRHERVVAVSNSVAAKVQNFVPRERLAVIGNGIGVAAPGRRAAQFTRLRPAPGAPLLLAAGRLSHEKGFDVLLQAFALVKAERGDARLVIAGDGPLRAALQQQAKNLAIDSAVEWAGFVQGLPGMMRSFDLLLLPSRSEARPMVVLEAMTQGLPVVATSVGDVATLLEHGQAGSLVATEDPAALAAATLHSLRDTGATAKKMHRAQLLSQQCHSAEAMEAAYFSHYLALLGHERGQDDG